MIHGVFTMRQDIDRAAPGPENDVHLTLPVNILISFHYFRLDDVGQIASWGMRILADSGAFSAVTQDAQIDLDEYGDWISRWRPALYWPASLDVIGNAEASWQNWTLLLDRGISTVPTIHYPAPPAAMDRYVEAGADLIGLGGMVPFSSEQDRLLRWTLACFRYARDHHPEVRFHGWGINHKKLLMSLPWFSVDSSGFASSYRYGRLQLFDPDSTTFRTISIATGSREAAAHNRLLRTHYGIDWQRVVVSNSASRRDVVRTAMRSLQLVEVYLRKRWPDVTPPASLEGTGPNLHAVLGAPSMQPARSLNPADKPPRKEAGSRS